MEKSIVIYIPGFTYISKSPIEIDKIEAFASINEEEYPIHQLDDINNTIKRIDIQSKKLNTSNTSKKININGIITRPLKQSFLEKDPYEVDEGSSVINKLLTDYYSESARLKRIIRGRFIDIVDEDEKEKKYKHTISYVYDTAEPIVENFNYNEHDGLFYILVDKLDTDITFTFKLYTFIGEEYVYIGEKTIFYNPTIDSSINPEFKLVYTPLFYDILEKNDAIFNIKYNDHVLFLDDNFNVYRFGDESLLKINKDPVNIDDLVRYFYPFWEISAEINTRHEDWYFTQNFGISQYTSTSGFLPDVVKTSVKQAQIIPYLSLLDHGIDRKTFLKNLTDYFKELKNDLNLKFSDLQQYGLYATQLNLSKCEKFNMDVYTSDNFGLDKVDDLSNLEIDKFWATGHECGGHSNEKLVCYDEKQLNLVNYHKVTCGKNNNFFNPNYRTYRKCSILNELRGTPRILFEFYKNLVKGDDHIILENAVYGPNYGISNPSIEINYNIFLHSGLDYLLLNPSVTIKNVSKTSSKITGYAVNDFESTPMPSYKIYYNGSKSVTKVSGGVSFIKGNNPFSNTYEEQFELKNPITINAKLELITDANLSKFHYFVFNNAQLFADYNNSTITFVNQSDFSLVKIINLQSKGENKVNPIGYYGSNYARPNINTKNLLEYNKPKSLFRETSTFITSDELFWYDNILLCSINTTENDSGLNTLLNRGVYVFHINYFETDRCNVEITLEPNNGENIVFTTKNQNNKNKIVFYIKDPITIKNFTIKVIEHTYIKNFGLFSVSLDDDSNYLNQLLLNHLVQNSITKNILFEEDGDDCPFNYVVLPACYAYIEQNKKFYDKEYTSCALPDEPYIQVVLRYKLKNKLEREIDLDYPSKCGLFNYFGNIRKI